jgi:hypothetical protein
MCKDSRTYILFPTHTHGLKLHKLMKYYGLKHTIVPTPRRLSKSCGISIMVEPSLKEHVERILQDNPDIKTLGIHTV